MVLRPLLIPILALALLALPACKKKNPADDKGACATQATEGAGAEGSARVFNPDPLGGSGQSTLAPSSLSLDDYRIPVTLSNLGGRGLLEGKYVYSLNEKSCSGFGAFEKKNDFVYPHSDERFQEVMAYHFGDRYRAFLDSIGYLRPAEPVPIWAVCNEPDNAFYSASARAVCLGYSSSTRGAYYADDGAVTVHELQHATTIDLYSTDPDVYLNPYFVSEGGAISEGVSDFMGLLFTEPQVASGQDLRLFGRWSLGLFNPGHDGSRGAHRCPAYDSAYPGCANFPAFSAQNNTISYVYPDGLGWPHPRNESGPEHARSIYMTQESPEEIHNAGVLIQGALWDMYESIKAANGGDITVSRDKAARLTLEALRALPKPTASSIGPVNFIELANALVSRAAASSMNLSDADREAVRVALASRGLLPSPSEQLTGSWASAGAGFQNSGMKILDNPAKLVAWTKAMFHTSRDLGFVPEVGGDTLNGGLDAGETVVVWFDIKNDSAITAGSVQVTVTIPNEEKNWVQIHSNLNLGVMSPQKAQIIYAKINGTRIVSDLTALDGAHASYSVPTGNTYFMTQPYYDQSFRTGIWMKVLPGSSGQTVHFSVEAKPSNGSAATVVFPAVIR